MKAAPFALAYTVARTGERQVCSADYRVVCEDRGLFEEPRGEPITYFVTVRTWRECLASRSVLVSDCAALEAWSGGQSRSVHTLVTDRELTGTWVFNARAFEPVMDRRLDPATEKLATVFLSGKKRLGMIGDLVVDASREGVDPDAVLTVLYRAIARGRVWADLGAPVTTRTRVDRLDQEL